MDVNVVTVALPAIDDGLQAGPTAQQLLVGGYVMTWAVLLLPGGRLGDVYGHRNVFVAGMVLFSATSLAAGLTSSAPAAVTFRLIQGAGAALVLPQVLSGIQLLYDGTERVRAIGLYAGTMALASAVGQVFGGVVLEADMLGIGWRAAFLAKLPLCVAVLAAAALVVPDTRDGRGPDRWGTVLASLFHSRTFVVGLCATTVFFMTQLGFYFVLAIALQDGFGLSALGAALAYAPLAVGILAVSPFAGRFVARRRTVMAGGLVVLMASITAVTVATSSAPAVSALDIAPWMACAGAGIGLVFAPLFAAVLAGVPAADAGAASGVLNTAQQIGNALGVTVVGLVFFGTLGERTGREAYADALGHVTATLLVLLGVTLVLAATLPGHSRR
jgi:predicted MFS family arabinose efflux permease